MKVIPVSLTISASSRPTPQPIGHYFRAVVGINVGFLWASIWQLAQWPNAKIESTLLIPVERSSLLIITKCYPKLTPSFSNAQSSATTCRIVTAANLEPRFNNSCIFSAETADYRVISLLPINVTLTGLRAWHGTMRFATYCCAVTSTNFRIASRASKIKAKMVTRHQSHTLHF